MRQIINLKIWNFECKHHIRTNRVYWFINGSLEITIWLLLLRYDRLQVYEFMIQVISITNLCEITLQWNVRIVNLNIYSVLSRWWLKMVIVLYPLFKVRSAFKCLKENKPLNILYWSPPKPSSIHFSVNILILSTILLQLINKRICTSIYYYPRAFYYFSKTRCESSKILFYSIVRLNCERHQQNYVMWANKKTS